MENASKALLMAGGILIAMITISMFYFMFGNVGELREITDKDTNKEELLTFNQSFESYNKKLMYGSDVVSILNKAIDNNRKYNVENEPDNDYYMNIVIKVTNGFYTITEKYKKIDKGYEKIGSDEKQTLRAQKEYNLNNENDYIRLKNILLNVVSTIESDDGKTVYSYKDSSIEIPTAVGYNKIYYPAATFKRATFRCTGVKYNDKTGRISEMTFTERN